MLPVPHKRSHRHALLNGQFWKAYRDLECPRHASLGDLVHWEADDILVFEQNLTSIGPDSSGDLIEQSGLARAIRSNDSERCSLRNLETYIARHMQATEALLQSPN